MLMKAQILAIAILAIVAPLPARADDVKNIEKLCSAVEPLGIVASRCAVSATERQVSMTFDASEVQLVALCEGIIEIAEDMELRFAERWSVLLKGTLSAGASAQCNLPLPSRP